MMMGAVDSLIVISGMLITIEESEHAEHVYRRGACGTRIGRVSRLITYRKRRQAELALVS